MSAARTREIEQVARERFGIDRLRPGQREAIAAVLEGRDTLAVMSTGSGKSLIYQVAAMIKAGPTIVVSPLIALQEDQVDNLDDDVPGEAAELNSGVGDRARREALEDLESGELEFVFVAPEQLANDDVLGRFRAAEPSLLVVDEAHCVSEWGHDFRPDYLRLGRLVEDLGHPVTLALTATASPPVREEIVERLGMRDPCVVVKGFDRPNLRLAVERFHDGERKRRALVDWVAQAPRPGIVYAATRRLADEIAEELAAAGMRTEAYHAGIAARRRDAIQERFMTDELDAIVATTAFGMGIDKPNVRWVVHHDVAESVDAYYQEIGRAGRDDEPADAVLFYRPEDVGLRRFFAGGMVAPDEMEQVVRTVRERGPVEPEQLVEAVELSRSKVATAVNRLEDAGAVETLASGAVAPVRGGPTVEQAVEQAAREESERHEFDRSRVEMMRAYAEHDRCRRAFVLSYFGEPFDPPCGNCDNCEGGRGEQPAGEQPFAPGSRVTHDEWGVGAVQRYDGDKVVVLFDAVGYKTLATEIVLERSLLAPE